MKGWLTASALTIALVIVGCGGGGEETSTVRVAKGVFLKRADAICAKIYKQVESEFQSFTKSAGSDPFSDFREVQRYADTVLIPAKQQEVEELRALGAPGGDEDDVGAILEAYEEGIELAEEDPRAAVTSTFGVFGRATKLAEEYGLENCYY